MSTVAFNTLALFGWVTQKAAGLQIKTTGNLQRFQNKCPKKT